MRCSLPGWLLFFFCMALCFGQEPEDVQDLAAGHPVSVLLTPEHGATLRLNLNGSETEEIFLDAAISDISYWIRASDGSEILSGRLATFGWAAIPISAAGRRNVQIQLKTESGVVGLPGVRVRAELRSIAPKTPEPYQRAATLFNGAQMLHRSLRAEDVRQAIGQFARSAEVWGRAGDLYGESLALGGEGESEIELSRYADAKQTLDRALVLSGNNAYLRGWLLHLAARVLIDQWLGKQVQGYAEEELKLGEEIGDAALIALARTDLAGVAYWLPDSNMGQIADQASNEAIAAGVPETLALGQHWKGWVEESVERDVRAVNVLSESETNFRRAGDLQNALEADLEVAGAINLNGDLYSALTAFSKLEPAIRASGNDAEYGTVLYCIGDQYRLLNKRRLAEMYYRRADAIYARSHILFGRVVSRTDLCETETSSNDTANAVADCKLALAFARQFKDEALLGEALYDVGLAERKSGNLTQAIADFREAVDHGKKYDDLRWESKEHIQLGELLEEQGKRPEALPEFQQAESLSQGVADPASLLEAQYAVARWYAYGGQHEKPDAELDEKADEELAPALEKLEAARRLVSSSTLQASYFASERKCYELAVELRMRQFERERTGGADALALEISERARARGLLDALSAKSGSGARESGASEVRLMQAKLAVDRAFNHRLKLLVEGGANGDLESNSAELTRALADMERTADEAHAASSQATKPAPTMSAAEIERVSLVSGATFFEYALGAARSFLWVIGGGKRTSYILPPRQQLEAMVKQWRASAMKQVQGQADDGARFQHLSSRLSCALFADAVQPGMSQMVIVPDGELVMLPFAALPEHGCSNTPEQPLVVRHEITLTPSLSVFLARKPEAKNDSFKGEVAIVADPVFDAADPRAAYLRVEAAKHDSHPAQDGETAVAIPRLLYSGHEANSIQDIVRKAAGKDHVFLAQGFDASVDTVLSPTMQQYRIWHLATHGVYDETMPEFSGLVFSLVRPDGGSRFGFLKAYDIARLNVHAELVVLSACDSAAGEKLSGEGVMGLSYSFLRAGAREVVSTLWNIDDAQSRELMIGFYKELMRNGGNAAAALRHAQLTAMRQFQSSAPYYWAGFELDAVGK
jgi:CHAT domain-containing protein/tetratricopeptide (TPR) repeat protein